ncbi:MAG: helix-turn-helix transcriptional regulator [Lachnospiraceae bacterium]|nr:helix-turn-helix transcriptional regulator [Lachnospiraceae bacterium]
MNLELLKQERVAKGFTQKYMAEALGFKDRSSYCLIEKGKCSVDIELANRIASVLDLSDGRTFEIFFASKVQTSST